MDKTTVGEYMTEDIISVSVTDNVSKVGCKIRECGYNGYPVCENGELVGYVSATSMIGRCSDNIGSIMSEEFIVVNPQTDMRKATRIMFRECLSVLPVVDDNESLVGIITNKDIIRSKIERSTPQKLDTIVKGFEKIYPNNSITVSQQIIRVNNIRPTQKRIYVDELKSRKYELKNRLTEPIVVINNDDSFILVDGHHRCKATQEIGMKEIDAYVVEFNSPVKTGLEQTAESQDIESLSDIEILDEHINNESIYVLSRGC